MKFTIERKALARMLRVLRGDKAAPGSLLRLSARDGQIVMQTGDTEAGCEGRVLEEGVCFFRAAQFLPLVRSYANAANLTVEVTPDGIQIGSTKISRGLWEISLFENPDAAPAKLVFLTSREEESPAKQLEFDFHDTPAVPPAV